MEKIFFAFAILFFFISCEKDDSNFIRKDSIQGRIEKGPFVTGSKVTLYELDNELKQTGKHIFTTVTTDDIGSFSFDSKMELSSPYVEIEIDGYFFNEYKNDISDSQIKLNAIADISNKSQINVNILTHLEFKRIKKLVTEGTLFANAKKQAMSELLKVFHINDKFGNPEDISFFDGTEESTALLAISAILLEGKSEGVFSQYLAMLSNNFAEKGVIDDTELIEEIKSSSNYLNSNDVKSNLVNFYKKKGYDITIGDVWRYVDHNGDEVLDDSDLNKIPETEILPELSIFDDEALVKSILTSNYSKILSYMESVIVLDAIRLNHELGKQYQITPTNQFVQSAYAAAYNAINTYNFIIERIAEEERTYDVNQYMATAKVLRALLYLDMVQHWGDLPLITKTLSLENISSISRTNAKNIYSFLENDLKDVRNNLPNEEFRYDNPFVPAALADAVLGIIALERGNDASAALERIINSGIFKVENKSVDIYNSANSETLFGLKTETSLPPFSTEFKKGSYHPVVRFSGIILNYAEALLTKGNKTKAIEMINLVRSAKGLSLYSNENDIARGITTTWKEVYNMDYGYFLLLKRLGLAVQELGIPSYMQLLPIPQRELDLIQNMTQNPGYKSAQ